MIKERITRRKTIFLVEDNKADIRLIEEGLKTSWLPHQLVTVRDGIAALAYLYQSNEYQQVQLPDMILLDLNLPKKDGREVLVEIKAHSQLKHIPIIILTTSQNEKGILHNYDLRTNLYITKPHNLSQLFQLVKSIEEFWLLSTTLTLDLEKQNREL